MSVRAATWPGHPSIGAQAPETALRSGAVDDASRRKRVEALYREHHEAIARRIRNLTQDPSAVDDMVSETFLRAYRALDRFEGRSKESTWLHGIAINVARNHVDKMRRRTWLDRRFATERPVLSAPPADADLREASALQRFRDAVLDLPAEQREAFVLRVLEQRPWKETAELLSLPISTLHARVARAEAAVRARVGGEP